MKKKEVIIFLIISLIATSSIIVSADNFLSGYSIFDKFSGLFENTVNFFKNLFGKGVVVGIGGRSNCCSCIDEEDEHTAYEVNPLAMNNEAQCEDYCTRINQEFGDFMEDARANDGEYRYRCVSGGINLERCNYDEEQYQERSCDTNLQGICSEGTKTRECDEYEGIWGDWSNCIQDNQPRTEDCTDEGRLDEDCDGLSNNDDSDCRLCGNGRIDQGEECDGGDLNDKTCININRGFNGGSLRCGANCRFDTSRCNTVCTNGQRETEDCDTNLNGICSEGTKTRICNQEGGNFEWSDWGRCSQINQPRTEDCIDEGRLDEDCDGLSNNDDSDCIPQYHLVCYDNSCRQAAGAGDNECSTNTDCMLPVPQVTLTVDGNTAVLIWNNVLREYEPGGSGRAIIDITGFTVKENNFFIKIFNSIKELLGIKKVIGEDLTQVKYYELYEYIDGTVDYDYPLDIIYVEDCNEICEYRIENAEEGKYWAITSTIDYDRRSPLVSSKNIVGPFTPEKEPTQCTEETEGTCKNRCSQRGEYMTYHGCIPGIYYEDPYNTENRVAPSGEVCCVPIICGDNTKGPGETCDGIDLDGKTCETKGFVGGDLRCSNNCLSFDTSQCHNCGNGIIDQGEECEFNENGVSILPIISCSTLSNSYISGNLGCYNPQHRNRCKYDKSNCQGIRVVPQENCNNRIDDDEDGAIDCVDTDCWNNDACGENTFNNGCGDGIDNDHDGLVDSLDKHCPGQGLQITSVDFEGMNEEFWQYSKISIIECGYQINPAVNHILVKECLNITLNDRNMNCESKTSNQNQEQTTQGSVEFRECNVGSEVGTKVVKCEVNGKCKGYPSSSSQIDVYVEEFNICTESEDPELQEEQGTDTFTIFTITKPEEGNSFEKGATIDINAQVKNRFTNEEGRQSSIDAKVEATLISIPEFEEIKKIVSEKTEIGYLRTNTFELKLPIPEGIGEGNYRIYTKVYRDRHESEMCRSNSVGIKITGVGGGDGGEECTIDEDEDGSCEDEDCDDNNPSINPEAQEICIDGIDNNCDDKTDFADENCIIPEEEREQPEERRVEDTTDSDNDGLPDYWEYNYFGNLQQGPNEDSDNDGISNINEYIGNTNPKVPDKKKSSALLNILLIILGIVIIAGIIILIISKIKNKPRRTRLTSNYSLDQINQNKIQQYIQQAKAQGMKKQDIKNSLINAGWKEQDINKFL